MDATERRRHAIDIFNAGVRAAELPFALDLAGDGSHQALAVGALFVPTADLRRIVIVGAGKAAEDLHRAVARCVDLARPSGCEVSCLLLVPERLHPPRTWFGVAEGPSDCPGEVCEVRPRDGNLPTADAVAATARVLHIAADLGPDDLLLCLFTGGGSATLCAPAAGLTLADKLEALRLVTQDGRTIEEINTLRRHISAVKGGRLAEAAAGARAVMSVLVSDVDLDLPHVIASGPAVPDPTTYADALALRDAWPEAVRHHLERGCRGELAETPKSLPPNVAWEVVRSPEHAVRGAALRAADRMWRVVRLPRPTPARFGACVETHLAAIRAARPGTALLSVGEAPVALPSPPPPGGRAGHLAVALGAAVHADPELRGRVTVLVGATDGEDGTSGSGGGLADDAVLRLAAVAGVDVTEALRACESLRVLSAGGGLLPPRATGTNVQDLRVILVDHPPHEEETP